MDRRCRDATAGELFSPRNRRLQELQTYGRSEVDRRDNMLLVIAFDTPTRPSKENPHIPKLSVVYATFSTGIRDLG